MEVTADYILKVMIEANTEKVEKILLASCIRYDLTGEKVNPSIFYNSSMRELKTLEAASGMEDFHEKMISTNDELVEKYGLPKKFIWKE